MKKPISLLAGLLFSTASLVAQSSYLVGGLGFMPNSTFSPIRCTNCQYQYAIESFHEYNLNPGYSFYLGVARDIRLSDYWTLQGAWKIQHMEYPIRENGYLQERSAASELLLTTSGKNQEQHTGWQISLALERTITLLKRNCRVFGGGYIRVKLQDWTRTHSNNIAYYTDLEYAQVYDSVSQRYVEIISSKTKSDPPQNIEYDGDWDSDRVRPFNFGIQGGLTFPLLPTKEGQLSGQVMISQDFQYYSSPNRYYYFGPEVQGFRQTSIRSGVIFRPEKVRRPKHNRPEKRTLSSGIYAGIAVENISFSMNGSWLSSKNFGLDFSARHAMIASNQASVYFGPHYRLGNSRFFIKSGLEYLWEPNSEGYSEALFLGYAGGKYIAPFSRVMGLQVDFGYYTLRQKKESHGGHIGFGIGIIFMPASQGATK